MEARFTKDEWFVDYSYTTMLSIGSDSGQVCEVDSDIIFNDYNEVQISPSNEQKANAYLIAQAPAMYEMLEAFLFSGGVECYEKVEIEKLLAKARGEK